MGIRFRKYMLLMFIGLGTCFFSLSSAYATSLTWVFDGTGVNGDGNVDFVIHEIFSRVTDGEVDVYLRYISGVSVSTLTVDYTTIPVRAIVKSGVWDSSLSGDLV